MAAATAVSERERQIKEAEELLGSEKLKSLAGALFFGRYEPELARVYPNPDAGTRAETETFLQEVKAFLREQVDPDAIDREAWVPQPVMEGLVDLGVMTMSIPREYGGEGLSQHAYCRVMEEIGAVDASLGVLVNAHQSIGLKSLLLFGTPAQREEWLPRLVREKVLAAFALTEPNAGSDAGGIETRAVLNEAGTHYLLNGVKQWITNGGYAGLLTVMAKVPGTQDDRGRERITAFLVTPDMQGFEVVYPGLEKCGIRGTQTAVLAFHDMAVPVENIIGKPGHGLRVALTLLDYGRTTFGATCTGIAKRCLAESLAHCRTRRQFGKPLIEFGLVKEKLARMAATTYAMESATHLTAGLIDSGADDYKLETAILKVYAGDGLWEIINDTIQLFGGRAYFKDLPYERMMRDARINLIGEGANDVLRTFIGLVGMRDVGFALKDVLDAAKAPVAGFGKLTDFAKRHLPGRDAVHVPVQHLEVSEIARSLEELIREFGHAVEGLLMRHREAVLDNQHHQARIANAAIDLYHLLAVVVRLDSAPAADPAERRRELETAGYFRLLAERRIRASLREIGDNVDGSTEALVARL
jgi:alkylation response protein AidB-like acyl-CoA dehydrogenase